MKILQVVQFFSKAHGGSAVVPYELSKYLARMGHDVTIATTDYKLDRTLADSLLNVEVKPFHCLLNFGGFLFSPALRRYLRANISTFDIVHLHNYRTYQNVLAHHFARKNDIPFVLQAHGSTPRIVERQRLKKVFDVVWGYKILKDASKLIAVSDFEIHQYAAIGDTNKVIRISNGIDIERFQNLPEFGTFREEYALDYGRIILYLGRIHKRKRLDFLVKAFNELAKETDDTALVVAGPDGGYRHELEDLIDSLESKDRIRLVGFVPNELQAYVDADVVVYPSVYEIFGLVPFEAILCGTPVIVTDDCGCGQLIAKLKCGFVVREGRAAELNEKIEHLFNNPTEGKEMTTRGKKYIEDNLAWSKIVLEVESTYENCIRHV